MYFLKLKAALSQPQPLGGIPRGNAFSPTTRSKIIFLLTSILCGLGLSDGISQVSSAQEAEALQSVAAMFVYILLKPGIGILRNVQ